MTQKELIHVLIDRLDEEQLSALTKIVESMIYPVEELTSEEKAELAHAVQEYKNGKFLQGKAADGWHSRGQIYKR